ncbi:glycosyltransferase family 4 protein [Thermus caldilimi]|uniref:glycosyltransferase family 4 protein n=1 Tax=Thermus caldilimi TaxID=2483360 RepID=UPI0023EF546A|nr:glycosyltransferase family 4 protein [Thermus caldilimi]
MPALDALLLTSAYEGIPYVVLEALALGVPVVSAPTPGLGPWLRAEGLALVAEDGSPEALAEALKAVLREPSLAGRLAERGYAWTGKWGLEGMVERTFDLYRLLQASHKPPV